MNQKILFVDDDANLLAAFQRNLRKQFTFDTALGAAEALQFVQTRGPYALILADMRMPGMDGVELLARVRELSPDTVRMMLTGNADQQTAIDAVNRGQVFRFLNKPAPPEILGPALEAGLKHYQLLHLEREVLESTLAGSVKMLTDILGMAAPDALGRGQRLRDSITRLARHLNATPLWELELGALLSSIGCAAVPPAILHKVATAEWLRPEETAIVRRVPQIGHDLLIDIPRLAGAAAMIRYQAKNFDGSGFPADDVAGDSIPFGARMLRILNDRLDLEADGVVKQRAFDTMKARAGAYDPALLARCFECFPGFLVNAIAADRPVLSLTAVQLAAGHVAISDIATHSGITLVAAGHRLTASMIQRICNFAELGEVKEPLLVQQPAPDTPESAAA